MVEKSTKCCFLCPTLICEKESSEVVELKCHIFCWTCLDNYLINNLDKKIKCPSDSCTNFIPDRIIRKTLSAENILKYEICCLEGLQQSHRCLFPQCNAVIFYSDPNIQYQCQLCSLYNCIMCNAPHNFVTCAQYNKLADGRKKIICEEELNKARQHFKDVQRKRTRESLRLEDEKDVLTNDYPFSCWLCQNCIAKEQGVKLRDCSHTFCRPCLSETITTCNSIPVKCPMGCSTAISDREIQSLLSEEQMNLYQGKYKRLMKRQMSNNFQCKFPNCESFYVYSDRPSKFTCVSCGHENCVDCGVVHGDETCEEYRARIETNADSKYIERNIKMKTMMKCPDCEHLLHKTQGCNWIQCDRCMVELCWIRQMHRWGPKGRGDISGGCKCGVNKQFCHPDCRGCIPDHR